VNFFLGGGGTSKGSGTFSGMGQCGIGGYIRGLARLKMRGVILPKRAACRTGNLRFAQNSPSSSSLGKQQGT